jgi:hypothetical protein
VILYDFKPKAMSKLKEDSKVQDEEERRKEIKIALDYLKTIKKVFISSFVLRLFTEGTQEQWNASCRGLCSRISKQGLCQDRIIRT